VISPAERSYPSLHVPEQSNLSQSSAVIKAAFEATKRVACQG
jgi:hypothetical protein